MLNVILSPEELAEIYESPADSAVVNDADAIYSAFQSHAPELLIPIGIAHICQSATIQGTDTKNMSATFTILTRPKKTELNRGGRMVQIAPGPLGQGMKTENYERNPVVLFNHGMEGFVFPLGLSQDKNGNISLKCSQKSMSGTVYFSQKCPYAESIYGMVDDGLIRMASAGFNVEQMVPLEVDTSKGPQGIQYTNKYGYDCTQSDLIEWSVVVAGADAGALRQCCETGKYKGHTIRPQLIPVLKQYAEKPQAWGIGFGTGTIHQTSSTASSITPSITSSITPDIQLFASQIDASTKAMLDLSRQIAAFSNNFVSKQSEFINPSAAQITQPVVQQQLQPQQQQPQLQTQSPVVQNVVQNLDLTALSTQIALSASNAVAAELRPIQDAQQRLVERINQLTGKLPD